MVIDVVVVTIQAAILINHVVIYTLYIYHACWFQNVIDATCAKIYIWIGIVIPWVLGMMYVPAGCSPKIALSKTWGIALRNQCHDIYNESLQHIRLLSTCAILKLAYHHSVFSRPALQEMLGQVNNKLQQTNYCENPTNDPTLCLMCPCLPSSNVNEIFYDNFHGNRSSIMIYDRHIGDLPNGLSPTNILTKSACPMSRNT